MEPPWVGRFLANRMRSLTRVSEMPCNGIQRAAVSRTVSTRPAGVFPFRFRRQPILPVVRQHSSFAVEFGELLTVLSRLLRAHRINRCVPHLLMVRRICASDRFILLLRDRRFPQMEIVHESYFALLFATLTTVLGLRAPHGERTG